MELGQRLRRYRTEADLSQAALAAKAKISKTYVSEIESGAGRKPSGEVLLRLADALGVTIADLMGRPMAPSQRPQISASLRDFAQEQGLSESDVQMLSGIRYRGKPPKSKRRWAYIYDAIRMSEPLDREG